MAALIDRVVEPAIRIPHVPGAERRRDRVPAPAAAAVSAGASVGSSQNIAVAARRGDLD